MAEVIELFVMGGIIILLIILGIVFGRGKGAFLIAGYNTMSSEEQEKYDVMALTKFMGKMMFALAFSTLFWFFSILYDVEWLFYVGLALFLAIVGFMVIYANTGNRFKK